MAIECCRTPVHVCAPWETGKSLGKCGVPRPAGPSVTRTGYAQPFETTPCVWNKHVPVPNRWQVSQEGDGRSWLHQSTSGHPGHRMAGPTARCVACENQPPQGVKTAWNPRESDGGIDAGEPGGLEPPRRLSGGRCGHPRGQRCEACCRGVRRQRRHAAGRRCIGQCRDDRRWSRQRCKAKCIGP